MLLNAGVVISSVFSSIRFTVAVAKESCHMQDPAPEESCDLTDVWLCIGIDVCEPKNR